MIKLLQYQTMLELQQRNIIQSGAKKKQNKKTQKKRNIFKIAFLIPVFTFFKMQHIIYQIKHNCMNFMMVKTVSKIFYN